MQITIFGANGKVGSLIIKIALERGYRVVAFAHKSAPRSKDPNLIVHQGDIYDALAVSSAIEGSNAVVSALGSWHTSKKDILSSGMERIIPAMKESGINRVVSLTGADTRAAGDEISLMHKFSYRGINLTNGKIIEDSEKHLQLLEASQLDWTVLRSPIMNERGDINQFKLTDRRPLPWQTINRHSVALSMVNLIVDKNYSKKAPYIIRT